MEEKMLVEKMTSLLFASLLTSSPILSGNMKSFIKINKYSQNECEIMIEAPFYDLKKWRKEGTIIHTGAVIKGQTDYAELVNKAGGFGSHNKSEKWVNRACVEIATIIANEIGGTVINELEL